MDNIERPTWEQLKEEQRATQETPDSELNDLEYYQRYGWSQVAPTCSDPDCFMCGGEQ